MRKLLLKPFETVSGSKLVLFGAFFLIFGSYIGSLFNVNFDGVLDLHFTQQKLSFIEVLSQNGINIFCLFVCLFIVGKYINKKTRPIDILSTALVARVPLYFTGFFNYGGTLSIDPESTSDQLAEFASNNVILLISMVVFMIIVVVWMIALLFNGYKIATNAKHKNTIVLFIVVILAAEILSKVIIYKTIL